MAGLRAVFGACVPAFALLALVAGNAGEGSQVAASPASVEFLGQWGVHGQSPGQLNHPVALAIDSVERVYFADLGAEAVQKFTLTGEPLLDFEDSFVRGAAGIAVDSGGGIYVADPRAGELRVYFPEGELLRVIRIARERLFEGPLIFSVAPDGELFVPDPAGGRIQVLTPRGLVKRIWRVSAGAAAGPAHPVAAIVGPDGFVYVGDETSGRIWKFNPEGERIAEWENSVDAGRSWGLAVGGNHLFVLRGNSPRLEVWTLDGRQILTDDLGSRLSESPEAATLASTSKGELLVLDAATPAVLRFRIHFGQDQ